jgi:hypothetical protein
MISFDFFVSLVCVTNIVFGVAVLFLFKRVRVLERASAVARRRILRTAPQKQRTFKRNRELFGVVKGADIDVTAPTSRVQELNKDDLLD